MEARGRTTPGEAAELLTEYRGLARDLALARRALPGSAVQVTLEGLFARLHDTLFREPRSLRRQLADLYRRDVPRSARRLAPHLIVVTLVFLLAGLGGWLLVATYPETASLVLSQQAIDEVRQGRLWTDGLLNIIPSSVLSIQILANNIMVSVAAFAFGALYGLGTLYVIGLNGLMLGAVFAFTARHGMAGRLFEFVVAHGIVELTIVMVAGAAGMRVGEALVRPGNDSRRRAFHRAAMEAGHLLAVGVPFLVGCGFIEGYVSPDPAFPVISRIVIGVAWAVLFWLAMRGRLWPSGRSPSHQVPSA